jgi:hypothetical protein
MEPTMDTTHLSRRLEDLKAASAATRRKRRAARLRAPELLERLDALDDIAAEVAGVLEQLAQGVSGLATTRRLACGARVLAAAGVQLVPDPQRRRPRCAGSRLELRLACDAGDGPPRLDARAVVLDAELPLSTAAVTLPDGARARRMARAFAERCALEFARALLAGRTQVPALPPEQDERPDPGHGLDGTW